MIHTFYITREIEVETKILIKKEDDLYFAYVDDGQSRKLHCWVEDDDNLYTDECNTEEEYDCVIECFKEYILANGQKFARKCDKCGCGMNEGYVVYNGDEHYCTEECLNKVYTKEQWTKMYEESEENGGSDNYWTEWYQDIEEDNFNYVLFDNILLTF